MMRRLFIIVCLVCFVAPDCVPGDVGFGDSCYSFNRVHGKFKDANDLCVKMFGGSLVKITNIIDNNWMQKLAVNHLDADYNSFWIGASDAAHYTNWTWIDGSPMRFFNWGPGQPLEDRHCGTMLISTGKWFSQVCDERIQFLCQYPNGAYSPTCPPCLEI